ncbi:MAG: acetylornithine transaminase [Kiritimatiellia bacterium]
MNSKTNDIADLFNQYVMPTYAPTVALIQGSGSKVTGIDNMQFIDLTAGIATLACGHCHPAVTEAIVRQAKLMPHSSNLYYNTNMVLLAQKLSKLSNGGKCFFANSGAEANENMVKIARLYGREKGKYEVITFNKGFHGRTLAMCAATAQEKIQKGFDPLPIGFAYADFNDLASVEAVIGEKTVAIMLEPIQAEGGVIPATAEFMKGIAKLCKDKGLLLLMDEIQTGMGRTGTMFAWEQYGIKPDMFTLAKALGGGLPLSVVIAQSELVDLLHPGMLGTTFGGNPCACAAAMAVLDTIANEKLLEKAKSTGALLREGLEALMDSFPQILEIRGKGLLLGMVLEGDAKEVFYTCCKNGFLCCTEG